MRTMNQEKMEELADFIRHFTREHNGAPPRLSDIMDHMQMSKATAYRYLLALKKRGVVFYHGKKTLETELQRKMRTGFRKVPLVGQIICGSPEEQEEYITDYLAVPEEWLSGECFFLRAYGDSMADAGIREGDLILVKKTDRAKNGDVVVALTEEGNTLKRLFFEGMRPRLHAQNSTYPPEIADIFPKTLSIQGVALKVIKDII